MAQSHDPIQFRRRLAKPGQWFRHRLCQLDSQDYLRFVKGDCSRPSVSAHRDRRQRYSNTNPDCFGNTDTDANDNSNSDAYSNVNTNRNADYTDNNAYSHTDINTYCDSNSYTNHDAASYTTASPDPTAEANSALRL